MTASTAHHQPSRPDANQTYRLLLSSISAADAGPTDFSAVKKVFSFSSARLAAVRLSRREESGSGCSAGATGGLGLRSERVRCSERKGGSWEKVESVMKSWTAHFFHPTIGMEMAHACQRGLGGVTSKIADVIGYEVRRDLPLCYLCIFLTNTWAWSQHNGAADSAAAGILCCSHLFWGRRRTEQTVSPLAVEWIVGLFKSPWRTFHDSPVDCSILRQSQSVISFNLPGLLDTFHFRPRCSICPEIDTQR